ncbi:MAG: penicillin-binding protein 2 [Sulfurimonadaceae bacterium]|nr:penicillin-binding protein 2 [Sulfurimonadaceae bacterium]
MNENISKKILLLYILLGFGFLFFLIMMLVIVLNARDIPSLYTQEDSRAKRGNIISADGFHITTTKKLYKAVVNTTYIDPEKKNLFIELFSIYSGMPSKEVRSKIDARKGSVVLSFDIPEKQAQYLKKLSYELRRFDVFMEKKNPRTGQRTLHGLSILESGESREYPFGNLLTPVIGYSNKIEDNGYTKIKGIKGLEKKFEAELEARQDALSKGPRDVNSYIILNKESLTKQELNGLDIKLNIKLSLQLKIERMLDTMKEDLRAKEVMVSIMDAKNGNIVAMASSNRFSPKSIKKEDYPSLNVGMVEYSFEPGSVLKTVVYALLLDKGLINPYDLVNGHNGKFKIGNRVITDEHKYDWLSAENVIVQSSNIGIAQLAQKLSGVEFHEGLKEFGFGQSSTRDLIYEKSGSISSPTRLNSEIYKASTSYGYSIHANLMQIQKAYSAFNNNGRMLSPRIIDSFIDEYGRKIEIPASEQIQVIKSATAERVKQVLIKTVNEGTGVRAKYPGLIVGGKTGTAHIVENGRYVNKYHTTFAGFANDEKNKFNVVTVVIEPRKIQFASYTAVPIFRKSIELLVEEGYLKPDIIE